MDSFTTISFTSGKETTSAPVEYEKGSTSNTYCVIAQRPEAFDVPVDEEKGSTSNTYCVIA